MISRERARTVRLVCQSAAAVFVGGAALVAVFGSPFGGLPTIREVAFEDVQQRASEIAAAEARPEQAAEADDVLPPDMQAIEYSLSLIENAPKPAAPATETTPDEPATSAEAAPPPEDVEGRTRFLGTVKIGDRFLALLSAGGAQRIMAAGESRVLPLMPGDQGEAPKVTVYEVTPETVRITENGIERRIDRAPRVGIAVSQGSVPGAAADNPRSGTPQAVTAGVMGEVDADKPINPDDFRREDGTIDYEALRAAARAKARARTERFRGNQGEQDGID